jgi:hypothetical protein
MVSPRKFAEAAEHNKGNFEWILYLSAHGEILELNAMFVTSTSHTNILIGFHLPSL